MNKRLPAAIGTLTIFILVAGYVTYINLIGDKSTNTDADVSLFRETEEADTVFLLIDGQKVQEISIASSTLADNANEFLNPGIRKSKFHTDLDVNFDGYKDVGVLNSIGYGGVNMFYGFYIYNPESQRLEMNEVLKSISNPEVDVDKKTVLSNARSAGVWYLTKYIYNNGEYDVEIVDYAANVEGEYMKDFASIIITRLDVNKIGLAGNAIWVGLNEGQVNSGIVNGPAWMVDESKGFYSDGYCNIELTFSENKLVAKDNNQCGGLNVSFTGEYLKVPKYVTQARCNMQDVNIEPPAGSDVVVREVFWSPSLDTCLSVHTSLADNPSDWVDKNKGEYEGTPIALLFYLTDVNSASSQASAIEFESYYDKTLQEYLKKPNDTEAWSSDFSTKIEKYRS